MGDSLVLHQAFTLVLVSALVAATWSAWRLGAFVRALRRAARKGHGRLVLRALRGPEVARDVEQDPPASAPPASMTRPTSDPPPRWRTVARRRVSWSLDGLGHVLGHASHQGAATGAP